MTIQKVKTFWNTEKQKHSWTFSSFTFLCITICYRSKKCSTRLILRRSKRGWPSMSKEKIGNTRTDGWVGRRRWNEVSFLEYLVLFKKDSMKSNRTDSRNPRNWKILHFQDVLRLSVRCCISHKDVLSFQVWQFGQGGKIRPLPVVKVWPVYISVYY